MRVNLTSLPCRGAISSTSVRTNWDRNTYFDPIHSNNPWTHRWFLLLPVIGLSMYHPDKMQQVNDFVLLVVLIKTLPGRLCKIGQGRCYPSNMMNSVISVRRLKAKIRPRNKGVRCHTAVINCCIWYQRQIFWKIFTGPTYKLLLSFTVISDV